MTEKVKPEDRVTIRFHGRVLKAIMELRIKREREIGKPTSMSRVINEVILEAFDREIGKEGTKE
jgi:hypothetical protein